MVHGPAANPMPSPGRVANSPKHSGSSCRLVMILCAGALACAALLPRAWAQTTPDEPLETLMDGFEQENPDPQDELLDQIISGFEEEADASTSDTPAGRRRQHITLDGTANLGVTWNIAHPPPENDETDWRGLSRLRPEIQLEMQIKPHEHWRAVIGGRAYYDAAYAIRGQDRYTEDVIDNYRQETEWREVFIQGRLRRNLDIKLGRQTVVWGRSDNIRITDRLNPLDRREPGLTDIEDLRLPVTMTRLDGYHGAWHLSAIALHEVRFSKLPVWGSDFFPANAPLPDEEIPSHGGGDTQWATALNGIFSGKDISFYWADLLNDQTHVALNRMGAPIRRHARITLHGIAGNLAMGNWLIKAEAAFLQGLKFFNTGQQTNARLDGLIGFEYSGWDETTISWEWAIRHLLDFDPRWQSAPDFVQEDEIIQAIRISRQFANNTIELTLLALAYGPLAQDGALERLSAEYDWTDAVSIKAGLVLYHSGDKYTLNQVGDNDRIFAEITYRF